MEIKLRPTFGLAILSSLAAIPFPALASTPAGVNSYGPSNPRYAEVCYVTKVAFKKGTPGGPQGHAVVFLKGACRDTAAAYPKVRLCRDNEGTGPDDGVGVSMDNNFANMSWVATEGKYFFITGGVAPNEPFTEERTIEVVSEANRRGIFRGVKLNAKLAAEKPANRTDEYWTSFQSLSTDFALTLGRAAYCEKIPITKNMMSKAVDFLNGENERSMKSGSSWSALGDNCANLVYSTLAAAGIWEGKRVDAGIAADVFQDQRAVPGTLLADAATLTDLRTMPSLDEVSRDPRALDLLRTENWFSRQSGNEFEGFGIHEYGNDIFKTEIIYRTDPLDLFGGDMRIIRQAFSNPALMNTPQRLALHRQVFARTLSEVEAAPPSSARSLYQRYLVNQISLIDHL